MGFDFYAMRRIDDSTLELIQPAYSVQRGDRFRVEYMEVFNNFGLSDNSGTSCVAVDFLFLSCCDCWNLPVHNSTDAMAAAAALHVSAANVLVQ